MSCFFEENELPLINIRNPSDTDVLLGMGQGVMRQSGNETYRALIRANKARYSACSDREEKKKVVLSIITTIRWEMKGRFLEKNKSTGLYDDVGEKEAYTKTRQALTEKRLNKNTNPDASSPEAEKKKPASPREERHGDSSNKTNASKPSVSPCNAQDRMVTGSSIMDTSEFSNSAFMSSVITDLEQMSVTINTNSAMDIVSQHQYGHSRLSLPKQVGPGESRNQDYKTWGASSEMTVSGVHTSHGKRSGMSRDEQHNGSSTEGVVSAQSETLSYGSLLGERSILSGLYSSSDPPEVPEIHSIGRLDGFGPLGVAPDSVLSN